MRPAEIRNDADGRDPSMRGAEAKGGQMRAVFSVLVALVLVSAAAAAFGGEPEERIGLDPVLQGVWNMVAVSSDRGRTIEPVTPPIAVAHAFASRIKFADGSMVHVEKVMIVDVDGVPGNIALLTNGNMLAFTKEPGQIYTLVQLFQGVGEAARETARYLIFVN